MAASSYPRLSELDPRWFTFGGVRAGFIFKCPCCAGSPIYLTCKSVFMQVISDQVKEIEAQHPDVKISELVPAKKDVCWNIIGDDFTNLSVTPSIDASPAGHWHGFITNGLIA